ncbi:MAG TPA: hypothetical protein PLJ21_03225 [Pseudobdellovibrionaceae bacterium]|nr:hypothetical protein [Pseudobdellovibrionaceae bacterium]
MKTLLNSIFKPFLFISFALYFILGCAATDADKIAEAQTCLDKATAATAEACTTKVSGLTSPGAYNIRCASKFISERFEDPNKYIEALSSISGGTGGSNMMNMMGLLMFSSKGNITDDTTSMSTTFDYCHKANTKGALLLSSFGYMGASLYAFASSTVSASCPSTPSGAGSTYALGTCLNAFGTDLTLANLTAIANLGSASTTDAAATQVQSAIGTIVITTYTVSCSTSQSNKELCDYFKTAINSAGGTSNTRAVAVSFIKTLIGI